MVIAGVILAVVVLAVVVSWWSEGYIGATEGIVLFAVYGGLLVGLFAAESMTSRMFALIPLVASAVWGGYLAKSWSMRSYLKEKVAQYVSAVDMDPDNFAARAKLAETLYELGERERAIAEMQIAVGQSPRLATPDHHTLRQWMRDEQLRNSGNLLCYRCGLQNERGSKVCGKCGSPLRYPFEPGQILKKNTHQFVVISVGLALAGASLALLPLKYALLPICFALLAAGGWGLLRRK